MVRTISSSEATTNTEGKINMNYFASLMMIMKVLGVISMILLLCLFIATVLELLWVLIKIAIGDVTARKEHEKNKA